MQSDMTATFTLPPSWETCVQVKKQQLELDMEQWTGSKLGKEYVKAVYCHPEYLTCMQSTSCKMPGWIGVEIAGVKIAERMTNNLRYASGGKWRGTKEPLDESERGD